MKANQGNITAEVAREGATTHARVYPTEGSMAADLCLTGYGETTLSPKDHDVPEIGEAIAIGRAIADLGNQLAEAWQERVVTKVDYDLKRIAKGKAPRYHDAQGPIGEGTLEVTIDEMVENLFGAFAPMLLEQLAQGQTLTVDEMIPGRKKDVLLLVDIGNGMSVPMAVTQSDAQHAIDALAESGLRVMVGVAG